MTFALLVISRGIHFAAVFALFGSSLFWCLIGPDRSFEASCQLPRTLRATIILLRIAAPIAVASGIVWLICILGEMTGGLENVIDLETWRLFFFETAFGPVSILRLALLAAILSIDLLPMPNRTRFAALLANSGLLLITQAWLGHAAEGGAGLYGASMIAAYSIHILAAGAWVGGLLPLLFALIELRNANPDEAHIWAFNVLSRYSLMGIIAVVLIVLSGVTNAGFRVAGSFGKLLDTSYGDVLFIKIALVSVILVLASTNRLILMPRSDRLLHGHNARTLQ